MSALTRCRLLNGPGRAGLHGCLQSRDLRRGDSHELGYRPLDMHSLLDRTAREPLHAGADPCRGARRAAGRGNWRRSHGFDERGDVTQVYVSLLRFFQPQKRLIREKYVGLFLAELAGSSDLEAFTDQAAGSSAIFFDRPTHDVNALSAPRGFRLYEPDRCNSFHCRKHSDAVAHAKTDKAPSLSRLTAEQPVRHLRRLRPATDNILRFA